jgi:hypothetical protein
MEVEGAGHVRERRTEAISGALGADELRCP